MVDESGEREIGGCWLTRAAQSSSDAE